MILPDDVKDELDETLEKINEAYPAHSRTSCNDENLYNCSTIFLHSRCDRCDALEKLRLWRIEYEYKELKAKKVTMAGGRTDGAYVEEYEAVGGLTLRDYFAAKALPSVMKKYCDYAEEHGYDEDWRLGIAGDAYSIADAMLEARSSV